MDWERIAFELIRREWLRQEMPMLCRDGDRASKHLPARTLAENANGKPRKRRWDSGRRRKWVVKPEPKQRKGRAA